MIIKEMFFAGAGGHPDRHADELKKLRTVAWLTVVRYTHDEVR